MIDNIKLALIRESLIDFFEITESLIVNGSFIKKNEEHFNLLLIFSLIKF